MVVKGRRVTQKEHLEKLKAELKEMTPRQRLEHLWEYYKWIPGIFLGVVIVVCVVIASIQSLNMEIRLSGVMINVDVSPDGYVLLQDGMYDHLGADREKELVELRNMQFENPYTTLDQTYALDVQESVIAMISADQLDYLLYDELALPFFMDPETVMDLRELFTEEELTALGSAVIRLQMPETGELLPLAIDISDTEFAKNYLETDKAIYLSFSVITSRKEACLELWQYIKGGETQLLTTRLAGTVVDAEAEMEDLQEGFFEAQGYVVGDDRLELTRQSFLSTEEGGQDVQGAVQASILSGALDYVVAPQATLEQLEGLADLRTILTEAQLEALSGGLIYFGDVPVAVSLSQAGITEGEGCLAFTAASTHTQACMDFWKYLTDK